MLVLCDEGYPEREIKVKVGCCKDSCSYWSSKISGTKSDHSRNGRLRKNSARDDYLAKYIATQTPTNSYKKIHTILLQNGTNITPTTDSRLLRF